ncbi:MAG: DUF2252 family protein, partial [Chitinophagaceae bacterium]
VVLAYEKKLDQLFLLDIKEAAPSSLQPYIKTQQPPWETEANRVVAIQRRVQQVSPALLEMVQLEHKSFVLKELQPMEDKMDFRLGKGKISKLKSILNTMGEITASGQLRSSGRQGSDNADALIQLSGKSGQWKQEILDYASHYAGQVVLNYRQFCKDFDRGDFSSPKVK